MVGVDEKVAVEVGLLVAQAVSKEELQLKYQPYLNAEHIDAIFTLVDGEVRIKSYREKYNGVEDAANKCVK
ncbi:MAG: hypothetical protein ACRC37_03035 [Lentisphaeria bacterium]